MSNFGDQTPAVVLLERFAKPWFAASFLIVFAAFASGQTAPATQPAPAPTQSAPAAAQSAPAGAQQVPAGTQSAPAAATPGAPAEMDQAPGLSSHSDEVSLDLVVHDKHRNAITDLKPEDFVVTDEGTPVKLTGFHLVTADTASAASTGHMITLVFDSFHGPVAKTARNMAAKVLKVLPTKKGYSFAVLDFSGRLRLLQGYTEDRKAVEDAVNVATESQAIAMESTYTLSVSIVNDKKAEEGKAKASSDAEKNLISIAQTGADLSGHHVDLKERARAQTLVAALQDTQSIAQEQHARLNLAGLLALVKSQQRIGDRKTIIYFTLNSQLDSAAKEMLKTISGAATRAGVSIYTVDLDALGNSTQYQAANALMNGQPPYNPNKIVVDPHGDTMIPMQQESGMPISGTPSPTGPQWGPQQDIQMMTDFARGSGEDRTNPFADTKSPMAALAKDTGGGYIDAQNNTKKPLQEMVQDLTTYYEASYVPPFKDYDGKFRAIAVKPVRAGLIIQTKTGYFALAPGAEAGTRPFEVPLLKTLAEPQLPSDIKFHAAVLRFGDLPDGNTSTLAVEIPLSEVDTKEDVHTNLFSAHVSVVAQIKDKDGVVVEHFGEDLTKRGALETLDRDHSATISLARHFSLGPGKYTLEVAVLDQNNEKAGAQRNEFEIPNTGNTVSLSDMVLVRKVEGVREDDEDPLEPLNYEHQKVTPNITGELPANAKGVSLFFILHPDPTVKEPATLEMEVIHNGKPGRRTPLQLRGEGARSAIPYLASFGSSTLSPGDYEVKAYLSQGGKTTEQSEQFTVAGAPGTETANADSKGIGGAAITADINSRPLEANPHAPGQLAITMLSNPAPALSKEEARLLIEDARDRALSYNNSLPNFMCIEVTNRSVDLSGAGKWKMSDTLVELLRYREKTETRTMLEVNGKANNTDREAMKGALSAGEFGGVLEAVFRVASKADFQWKETDSLNGGTVQVYDYRVLRANSMFSVTASTGKELVVGFHGQVFIDTATRSARRITIIADDLPPAFPTHASMIGVDYDYVSINEHDYLMPVSAQLQLRQGRHEAVLNTMEFRNYKRFGSNLKILGFTPMDKQ